MSQNNDQTEILREILKWIKVSSYREVKDFLNSILKTNTEKLIYQYSNGESSRDVIKKARSSAKKVSDSWKEWKKLGIGDTIDVKGGGERFKRTFDLNDFGLLPKSTQNSSQIEGDNDA